MPCIVREDDEISAEEDSLDEAIAAIVDRPLAYDPDEVALAGVFVSIDRLGGLVVDRGYVRPEDEPGLEIVGEEVPDPDALRERADPDEDAMAGGDAEAPTDGSDEEDEQEDPGKPLPDRLVTELTTWRTLALRNAVALSPEVAFAAVLHALVLDAFYRYSGAATCVEISVRGGSLGTHAPGLGDSPSAEAIEQRHQAWSERLPDDPDQLWETLAGFDAAEQAALFAHCAAFGINAVWEPANRYNENRVSARTVAGRIAHSHVLARAARLDPVAAGWTATVDNYLGRVIKARILSAVEEARGSDAANRLSGLKKPDMAREAEALLEGSGWLAEPLRIPAAAESGTPPETPSANDDPAGTEADPSGTGDAEIGYAVAAE